MKTDIRSLIERYFEGETNVTEEKAIRDFFVDEDIPDDLKSIAPIFRYMEDESVARKALKEIAVEDNRNSRKISPLFKTLRVIAAVAAIALIAILVIRDQDKQDVLVNGNYVWVDGKRITDPEEVMRYAEISFQKIKSDRDLMEEQLNFIFE